ncbi:anti-sigma factor domain-containing protein, partial [Paracidovorax cattleyae]|uniref:anti-sigma factor domain-containing protein n=1 Tax=Paracidovorax cattleyae TaxID=80868 RepID=UPI0018B01052
AGRGGSGRRLAGATAHRQRRAHRRAAAPAGGRAAGALRRGARRHHAAPSLLVTFDAAKNALVLQRVGGYREAGDKSLQLWALPPGGAPRSLGVLDRQVLLSLPASEGAVHGVPALAVSLEPRGGVAGDKGPTGPVLFKGALIERMA